MRQFNRMVDADGSQYAVEIDQSGSCEEIVARLLGADGTVSAPFRHPEGMLRQSGTAYLHSGLTTWLAKDHRAPPVALKK